MTNENTYDATQNNMNLTPGDADGPLEKDFSNGK